LAASALLTFLVLFAGVDSLHRISRSVPYAGPFRQEEVMHRALLVLCAFLFASFGIVPTNNSGQEAPKDSQAGSAEYKITQDDIDRKNPVKVSPEGLASARKLYGFDCAMCHGAQGDGKGDLVESMKLTMHDWRDSSSLTGTTDGEIFYIITKGKGKMPGENDRLPETMRWNLVNLVRHFAKKDAGEKPASEAPKP
jgi:mono/diheme cytochrome c family protein